MADYDYEYVPHVSEYGKQWLDKKITLTEFLTEMKDIENRLIIAEIIRTEMTKMIGQMATEIMAKDNQYLQLSNELQLLKCKCETETV